MVSSDELMLEDVIMPSVTADDIFLCTLAEAHVPIPWHLSLPG